MLSPGTYSISVLDYLDDRSVLQVKDASGKVYSTFIGIQRSSTPAWNAQWFEYLDVLAVSRVDLS